MIFINQIPTANTRQQTSFLAVTENVTFTEPVHKPSNNPLLQIGDGWRKNTAANKVNGGLQLCKACSRRGNPVVCRDVCEGV